MAGGFSDHLPHFAASALSTFDFRTRLRPFGPDAEPPPSAGHSVAEDRALRDAVAAARAEFEKKSAEERADFEFRLAEKEQYFAESTADVLAEKLAAGLVAVREQVSGHVARALSRFLETAARDRALDEVSATVATLLAGSGALRVRVAGPAALTARLQEKLAGFGDAIEVAPGEGADLAIRIDDTLMETRIAAWADAIGRAAGGGDG